MGYVFLNLNCSTGDHILSVHCSKHAPVNYVWSCRVKNHLYANKAKLELIQNLRKFHQLKKINQNSFIIIQYIDIGNIFASTLHKYDITGNMMAVESQIV